MSNQTFIKIPTFKEQLWNATGIGAKGNFTPNASGISELTRLIAQAQFIQNFTEDLYYCTEAAMSFTTYWNGRLAEYLATKNPIGVFVYSLLQNLLSNVLSFNNLY
jgi:hypothetical protein